MKSILIAVAIAAGPALAYDMVYREGSTVVRLTEKPCTNAAVLNLLVPEHAPSFRAGIYSLNGAKVWQMCWIAKDGIVFAVGEEGSAGTMPKDIFTPDPGI